MKRNFLFIAIALLFIKCSKLNIESTEVNPQMLLKTKAKEVQQGGFHGTGALFLSKEEYGNLAKADFSLLKRISLKNQLLGTTVTSSDLDGTYLITPISGDQGMEGSCVGWAVGYSAMGILSLPKYNYSSTSYRSPEYVYNQVKVGTCSDGAYITTALNLIKNQGVCSWDLMPYTDGNCSTQPNQFQYNDALLNKSTNYGTLTPTDGNAIKEAIRLGWPVVIGFNVNTSFDTMWSSDGIWSTNSGTIRGGHAACIVGFDDSRKMFKVQNQWGANGGDGNGYFWVTYDLVAAGCLKEAYVVYSNMASVPLAISGDNVICTSSTYTVSNLPANSVVSWTAVPNGVVNLTPTGNIITATKLATGTFSLRANVSNSSGNSIIESTGLIAGGETHVGVQSYSGLQLYNAGDIFKVLPGNGNYKYSGTLVLSSNAQYSWSLISKSSGNPVVNWSASGNTVQVNSKGSGGYVNLQCILTGSCDVVIRTYSFYFGIEPFLP